MYTLEIQKEQLITLFLIHDITSGNYLLLLFENYLAYKYKQGIKLKEIHCGIYVLFSNMQMSSLAYT